MNLAPIKLIVFNTIQKEYRNRTLIFLFGLTVGMILLVNALLRFLSEEVLTQLSSEMVGAQSLSVFFFLINSWNILISVFLGVGTVRSDMEEGVIGQLLTLPVKRFEYLLSRIVGTSIIVLLYYLISSVFAMVLFSMSSGSFVGGINLLYALFFSFCVIIAVVVISIFFSLYMGKMKAFMGVMATSFLISLANGLFGGKPLSAIFEQAGVAKLIGGVIHLVLPRLSVMGGITNAYIFGQKVKYTIPLELMHFAGSLLFITVLVSWLFQRKDF